MTVSGADGPDATKPPPWTSRGMRFGCALLRAPERGQPNRIPEHWGFELLGQLMLPRNPCDCNEISIVAVLENEQ